MTDHATALRESEPAFDDSQFRKLFDLMQAAFAVHEIICDEGGTPIDFRFLFVNGAFERMMQLKASDIQGKTARQIMPAIDLRWITRYGRVALTGKECQFDDIHPERKQYFSIRAFCPELGKFAAIIQDDTSVKNSLKERDRLIAELRMKNEETEQLTHLFSHDLRGPLHTIRGFSDIMLQDLNKGQTATLLSDLLRIIEAAERMQSMFDDIAGLSRAGKVVGLSQPIQLGELVAEVLASLESRFAAGRIKVVRSVEFPEVEGDRVRLGLAIRSLLENAIKSLEHEPEPRIEIGSTSASGDAVIFIKDNGVGIPADRMASLCHHSLSADPSDKESGMAFAVVRRIVEAHGGRLWVESEGQGKGACFSFVIPRVASGSPSRHHD